MSTRVLIFTIRDMTGNDSHINIQCEYLIHSSAVDNQTLHEII